MTSIVKNKVIFVSKVEDKKLADGDESDESTNLPTIQDKRELSLDELELQAERRLREIKKKIELDRLNSPRQQIKKTLVADKSEPALNLPLMQNQVAPMKRRNYKGWTKEYTEFK